MKTAYLTGATGCIGRNLVNELQKDGWNIIVLHRKSSDLSKLDGCNVSFQEVDITDIDSVRKALSKPADVLFHLAANLSTYWGDADIQWKENVLATRNLTTVAMERGIGRFIFTSTGATLGSQWMDENVVQKNKRWIHPNKTSSRIRSL
jgi:dihydroflavonol-4-reductase